MIGLLSNLGQLSVQGTFMKLHPLWILTKTKKGTLDLVVFIVTQGYMILCCQSSDTFTVLLGYIYIYNHNWSTE